MNEKLNPIEKFVTKTHRLENQFNNYTEQYENGLSELEKKDAIDKMRSGFGRYRNGIAPPVDLENPESRENFVNEFKNLTTEFAIDDYISGDKLNNTMEYVIDKKDAPFAFMNLIEVEKLSEDICGYSFNSNDYVDIKTNLEKITEGNMSYDEAHDFSSEYFESHLNEYLNELNEDDNYLKEDLEGKVKGISNIMGRLDAKNRETKEGKISLLQILNAKDITPYVGNNKDEIIDYCEDVGNKIENVYGNLVEYGKGDENSILEPLTKYGEFFSQDSLQKRNQHSERIGKIGPLVAKYERKIMN